MRNDLLIFSGNANKPLAQKICEYLKTSLGEALVGKFNDGETRVEIETNVRGKDVFIIQSTCVPANENIMELLIFIDALRRASAQNITAVIPKSSDITSAGSKSGGLLSKLLRRLITRR